MCCMHSASTPPPRSLAQVITGFLGSGKTTLLNYILTQPHGKRIAGAARGRRRQRARVRALRRAAAPKRTHTEARPSLAQPPAPTLTHPHTPPVIENEFGEIDIDSELVARKEVRSWGTLRAHTAGTLRAGVAAVVWAWAWDCNATFPSA